MNPLELNVVYLAMPLSAPTAEGREANRRRAAELSAYIAWIEKVAVANTWPMLAEFWSEEQGREFGLKLDCAIIARCRELWLCGPVQELSAGMQIEYDFAKGQGIKVVDKRGTYDHVMVKPLTEQYSGGRIETFSDGASLATKTFKSPAAAHGEAIGNALSDAVNHPSHYNQNPSGVECIDVIEHLPFNVGSSIKYLWRAGLKDSAPTVQDLEKALWYINREVARLRAVGV